MSVIPFHDLVEALDAAPAGRPFVTVWIDEDEQETVTFGEFRERARTQAGLLLGHGIGAGDRVIILMPQGIAAMSAFAGAMMLGAIPAFLAYPNFKVEASKYLSGLVGVTGNLGAKAVMIDDEFPDEMLSYVSLEEGSRLVRASDRAAPDREVRLPELKCDSGAVAFIQHSAGTTGLQKGVALSHFAVLKQIEHLSRALKIDATREIGRASC